MKNVTKSLTKQCGFSLIELLIASAMGIVLLTLVGSVFLSGQTFALERSKQLMLAQDLNDAIRLIKTDAQRAGYNSNNSGSLVLSGALSTLHVADNRLSYIYEDENNKWRIVEYRVSGASTTLQMCEDIKDKGSIPIPVSASCGPGTVSSLIDPTYFSLSDFTLTPTQLVTSSATSTLLNISITASLANSGYSKTVSTTIKARNWK
ncbi:PilW family protein [Photobacterium nomapromontoriensis]|uniref:PilW family protein n=1 Tax=Photobacterium nomapromontoriensis TaxID=2910237 RepID=UPI003D13B7A5